MIVLILAGGRGNRLCQNIEKPLLEIEGTKMLDLVANAVKESLTEKFFVAVSPSTPNTKKYCQKKGFNIIETKGKGYHEDIITLLKSYPVFVSIASDIPFLKSHVIDRLINTYDGMSVVSCIPLGIIPKGVKPSHTFVHDGKFFVPIGVNIVTTSEDSKIVVFNNSLLGINVNTIQELEIAREKARRLRQSFCYLSLA